MIIIDSHVHVGVSVSDGALGRPVEFTSIMKRCGIGRAIIMPIDSEKSAESNYVRSNNNVIRLVRRNPSKFSGLCRIQPKNGKDAGRELVRCLNNNLIGFKLHPKSDKFYPEDCHEVFKMANHLSCPLMLHMDHTEGKEPEAWSSIFKKYKKITFVMAHGGGNCFRIAGKIANKLKNVYIDTSGVFYHRTKILLGSAGADKILFASDYPYSRPELEISKFKLLVKNRKDLRMIFSANAEKVWGV